MKTEQEFTYETPWGRAGPIGVLRHTTEAGRRHSS